MIWLVVFIVCCILARIYYSVTHTKNNTDIPKQTATPQKKGAPKVRSFQDWQKRTAKHHYQNEHSEYITLPLKYVQQQALRSPKQTELVDAILDAILDGKDYVKIKRTDWDRYNSTIEQK